MIKKQWKILEIVATIIIAGITLLFVFYELKICEAGDAAIYFPFFKNFFKFPFSYDGVNVKYGATSALWTIIGSFVHVLFPSCWFIILRIINILLVEIAVIMVNCALKGNVFTFIVGIFTMLYCWNVLYYVMAVFEIGLCLFCLALLIYLAVNNKLTLALIVSGLLYLVRPELVIFTILFDLYLLIAFKINFIKWLMTCAVSGIPLIIYMGYMGYMTRSIIPSSVAGRFIQSMEENMGWFQKIKICISQLWSTYKYIWILYAVLLVVFFVYNVLLRDSHKEVDNEDVYSANKTLWHIIILLFVGTICPHLVLCSTSHIIRYTSAIVILFVFLNICICKLLYEKSNLRYASIILGVGISFTLFLNVYPYYKIHETVGKTKDAQVAIDIILGKDLGKELNTFTNDEDKVLMHEIQMQYYTDAECISLDAIVGSEAEKYILKEENLADLVKSEEIHYIIIHESFQYRPLFDDSELEKLWVFDKTAKNGDTIEIDGLLFTKIIGNTDIEMVHGTTDVVYNDGTKDIRYYKSGKEPLGSASSPIALWTSVYKITW